MPLYRRIEFLEYQLAEFVHDPEFENVDLVYVLDSPGDAQYLRRYAAHLFRLYQVPFRLAVLNRNGGFAVVNNLGSSLAQGVSFSSEFRRPADAAGVGVPARWVL